MKTILVVDDMAVIRDPVAAALRLEGFDTNTAANGREALAAMQVKPADLVLLDVLMPEMDGLTFLKHLRADARLGRIPVVLLTAVNDKRVIELAAKLGVREFLIKSRFSLKNMVERIRLTLQRSAQTPIPATATATATATEPATPAAPSAPVAPAAASAPVEIPVLLTREECIERAELAVQVSALSGVVGQVISMAASPRADTSQLAQIIARDPMLSARVLQAANSAAYTSNRGAIMTIPDAVKQIGCSTVRNVAAAMGVFDAMPGRAVPAVGNFDPIRCWQHSFAVANLCEKFTAGADPEHADIAYLVGLCHDLGEIMFHTQFAAEFQQILEYQQKTGKRRDELERRMLGMTHNDLIVTILRRMNLPDSIRQPIEALHDPRSSSNNPLARVLRLANVYANGILLATSGASRIAPISRAECRAAIGSEDPSIPDGQTTRSEILGLTGVLARLSAADEARVMTPLYPRRDTRLWLARDKTLAKLDPIEAALISLAEVDVHDRLPRADELADHRGLVISARTNAVAGLTPLDLKKLLDETSRDYKLPVLWINTKVEAGVSNDTGVEPVVAPIPLEDVARFVDRLGAGKGSRPSGVNVT
jgi:HD-like signal output (HDOD) protein/DNA-binding NarL/FixJ family response regulator